MADNSLQIKISANVSGVADIEKLKAAIAGIPGVTVGATRDAAAGIHSVGEAAGESGLQIAELTKVVLELVGAYEALHKGYDLIKEGVAFNAGEEQARIGIATLTSALGKVKDANGEVLHGAEALTAAYGVADEQMEKLRKDSINTTAHYEDLVHAFQQALGPGLTAGLNPDKIREIVVGVSQAAGALGVQMASVGTEVRNIINGHITIHSQIARSLGLTTELVQQWKEQGTLATNLTERLAQFKLAGDDVAKSWKGVTSNLQDAFTLLSAESTKGLTENLKKGMADAVGDLLDKDKGGLAEGLHAFGSLANEVLGDFGRGLRDAIKGGADGLMSLSHYIEQNHAKFEELRGIAQAFAGIIRSAAVDAGVLARDAAKGATEFNLIAFYARPIALTLATVYDILVMIVDAAKGLAAIFGIVLTGTLAVVADGLRQLAVALAPNSAIARSLTEMTAQLNKAAQGAVKLFTSGQDDFINRLKGQGQVAATYLDLLNASSGVSTDQKAENEKIIADNAARNRAADDQLIRSRMAEESLEQALAQRKLTEKEFQAASLALWQDYTKQRNDILGIKPAPGSAEGNDNPGRAEQLSNST